MTKENKTVKVIVYRIPKKDYEKNYGKYSYGTSGKDNGHAIHLKGSIKSKKLIKGTVEHELGHIFSESRKIARKIPSEEKKRLLETFRQHEEYKRRGVTSGKEIMQETIADLYGWSKNPKHHFTKTMKKHFPKTMKIIRKESVKFKPKLVNKEWE